MEVDLSLPALPGHPIQMVAVAFCEAKDGLILGVGELVKHQPVPLVDLFPDVGQDLVQRFPGVVVLDEAYADFSPKGSLREKVLEYPNLVVLQTFSKAYGMAGLRLGMAFADAYVIDLMNRVKYPYNISQATQEIVLKALEQSRDREIAELVAQRDRLTAALPQRSCILRLWPSDANFLLVQVADADGLYAHLLQDGIIVRNRSRVPGCAGCLRLTIGTPEENDRLLQSLDRYEKSHLR